MTTAFEIVLFVGGMAMFCLVLFAYLRIKEQQTLKKINRITDGAFRSFLDAKVWFAGYDPFKRKQIFTLDPIFVLYSFHLADLHVLKDKLVVVGKTKILGRTCILSPFMISWTDKPIRHYNIILTRHIQTTLVEDKMEIQFHDPNYTNKLKMIIKNIGQELNSEIKKARANNG